MERHTKETIRPAGTGRLPDIALPALSDDQAAAVAGAQRLHLMVVLGVPLLMGVGLLVRHFSLGVALPLAAVAALGLLVWLFLTGQSSRTTLIAGPLALAGGLLFAHFAGELLRSRLLPTLALAAVTLALYLWLAARPLAFYRRWREAAEPDGSAANGAARREMRPRVWVLCAVLAVAVHVPQVHSTTLAIVAVVLLCAGMLLLSAGNAGRPLAAAVAACRELRRAREVYLAWPDEPRAERGEHGPQESLAQRRRVYYALTIPLLLTLTVSLSFCCPWELFAHWFSADFVWLPAHERPVYAYDWLTAPFSAAAQAGAGYLWTFVIALPLLILLPEVVLLTAFLPAVLAPAAAPAPAEAEESPAADEWERRVERLARSRTILESDEQGRPRKTEAEHLFFGLRADTGEPVPLDRAVLAEHLYITGRSGSGKTALGMIPLLVQLIRGYDRPVCDEQGQPTGQWRPAPPSPILVLDLKGDAALFQTARIEAERAGREFLFFSADARKATHRFDVFGSLHAEPRTPIEVCELLIQALNLFHGEQYGASYYSRQHRKLLLEALAQGRGTVRSWQQLYDLIEGRYSGRQHRDATELLTVIHALTFYEQLSLDGCAEGEPVIRMPEALDRAQVVYFWLPSLLVNMSTREIAKLALYCFLTAAADRKQPAGPVQSYVFIDELQRIAAENVKVVFQQCRGSHIGLIVANQDPSDLKLPHVDVRAAVRTNARLRQCFSLTDRNEIDEFIRLSGEESQYLRSTVKARSRTERYDAGLFSRTYAGTNEGETVSESYREVLRPRLSINEIIAVNNSPTDSLVHLMTDVRATRLGGIPTRIRGLFAMSRDEFEQRDRTPPAPRETPPGMIVPQRSPEDVEAIRSQLAAAADASIRQALEAAKAQEGGGAPQAEEKPDGEPGRRPKRKRRSRRKRSEEEREGDDGERKRP